MDFTFYQGAAGTIPTTFRSGAHQVQLVPFVDVVPTPKLDPGEWWHDAPAPVSLFGPGYYSLFAAGVVDGVRVVEQLGHVEIVGPSGPVPVSPGNGQIPADVLAQIVDEVEASAFEDWPDLSIILTNTMI